MAETELCRGNRVEGKAEKGQTSQENRTLWTLLLADSQIGVLQAAPGLVAVGLVGEL